MSLQQHSVNLGSYWKLSASCSAETKKFITCFKTFKQSGKLHICMRWLGVFVMPQGSLCVLCGFHVLLSCPCCLLTSLQSLPWFVFSFAGSPHPTRGSWPQQHLPQGPSPIPWPPTPSSWSKGLSAGAPRGGGCISAAVESAAPVSLLDLQETQSVWCAAVQLDGRAEAFDNHRFCFFLFSKI